MATEKRRSEERRSQLARAVLDIISTHGLRKLSVGRVARRVGLVPSAIYRHFHSKGEMLDASLEFIGNRLHLNVKEVCEETQDPLERIRRLLMRHAELIRENQAIPRMIFSEELYHDYPERKARLRGMIQGYLAKIEGLFRDGQRQGKIIRTADPATLSVMLLGLFQPAAILWYLTDGDFDVTRHVKRAWTYFRQTIESQRSIKREPLRKRK